VTERARAFIELARGELHVGLLPGSEPSEPVTFATLSRALLYAANAAISLTAFPAAGRRLVLKLESAAQKLKRLDLSASFTAFFDGSIADHLVGWSEAYRAGQSLTDELIHPARRTIYERGFLAQAEADRAADGLWLMLYTWQALMKNIPTDSPHGDRWSAFLESLDMASPSGFAQKVTQAHDYLDLTSDAVDRWAEQNGA
jgi:TorA maturation chaperone TorD